MLQDGQQRRRWHRLRDMQLSPGRASLLQQGLFGLLQGAMAAADGDPVAVQVVLTGTPGGGLTAFIQLKSGVALGAPLPALYASQQLLAAQPYVSGARRLVRPFQLKIAMVAAWLLHAVTTDGDRA